MYKIKIDITNPITPPNLFAIARKIEYANRNHLIWVGAFIGCAILKLSGSPRWQGNWMLINIKMNKIKYKTLKDL